MASRNYETRLTGTETVLLARIPRGRPGRTLRQLTTPTLPYWKVQRSMLVLFDRGLVMRERILGDKSGTQYTYWRN